MQHGPILDAFGLSTLEVETAAAGIRPASDDRTLLREIRDSLRR